MSGNYNANNYCTIAGKDYIIKLLAFYQSLRGRSQPFHLYILCIDDTIYWLLKRAELENVTLTQLWEVEDAALQAVKLYRKTNEYCWTLKPVYLEFVLTHYGAGSVLYCDSDIYFFGDPAPVFNALRQCSIYLCPQRDMPEIEQQYGKYQAGMIGFSNTAEGMSALMYWRARCIAQCSAVPSNGTFGDQKYLDDLPLMYSSIYYESNLGVDAAPWNCVYHNPDIVNIRGNTPYVGNDELIAFHFATMIIFSADEYDLWSYGALDIQNRILNHIYLPYIESLRAAVRFVVGIDAWYESIIFANMWPSAALTYFKYDTVSNSFLRSDEFYTLCAIASDAYVTRAMVLYSSLIRHQQNFHIWYCAVDDSAYEKLQRLNMRNATIIHVRELRNQQLLDTMYSRKLDEFCWTLKPFLIKHLFDKHNLKRVLYLDSDMYFFAPLANVYNEWGTYSFLMCTQRASEQIEHACGMYQAGLIGVKNDHYGLNILHWWRDRCLEWCYDYFDETYNRWGDQKYLDRVPNDFENIKIVTNVGINAAPWNIMLNNVGYYVYQTYDKVFINSDMLSAYHFGSIGISDSGYDVWTRDSVNPDYSVMQLIYSPYFAMLDRANNVLAQCYWGASADDMLR